MVVNAFDEFGYILWYYAPHAYYHYLNGDLKGTRSKLGTKPVFYFSEDHNEDYLHYDPPKLGKVATLCYNKEEPFFTKYEWTPPPYKSAFKNDDYLFDKPILTIHNKNSKEWMNYPVNYFDSIILNELFETFKHMYQVIYIRPPKNPNKFKLQIDRFQDTVDIGDLEVLKKHPEVIYIEDLLENTDKNYNQVQFMLLANSDKHITPAGDAVIPSYFGGDVVIYNCPNCTSANRGVWKTNSWLKILSGANIYGYNKYQDVLSQTKNMWL